MYIFTTKWNNELWPDSFICTLSTALHLNEINIVQESSLTQQAGSTTHPKLTKEQRADILNNLIPVVTPSERLIKVDLNHEEGCCYQCWFTAVHICNGKPI